METYTLDRPQRAGRYCAKYTFILGPIIFLLFSIKGMVHLQIAGGICLVTAFVANAIVLFVLFINLLIHPDKYLEILKTMALMMLNIPIMLCYIWMSEEIRQITPY